MERKIILTEDGSHSLRVDGLSENYHSGFGALSESMHIFINAGLKFSKLQTINLLEIGFGTGLNAYLTFIDSVSSGREVHYYSIEKYPVIEEEWSALNYPDLLEKKYSEEFFRLHRSDWDKWCHFSDNFHFFKSRIDLKEFRSDMKFDLVYFDAFAPDVQPELWTGTVFKNIYNHLNDNALILTYSVKGIVKRNLIEAGFNIEKIPGPKGKRHILRARK